MRLIRGYYFHPINDYCKLKFTVVGWGLDLVVEEQIGKGAMSVAKKWREDSEEGITAHAEVVCMTLDELKEIRKFVEPYKLSTFDRWVNGELDADIKTQKDDN